MPLCDCTSAMLLAAGGGALFGIGLLSFVALWVMHREERAMLEAWHQREGR